MSGDIHGGEEGTDVLLAQYVFYRPPDLKEVTRKEGPKFGFPLMWNTDLVEMAGIMGKLGAGDERMDEAVLSKQGENGRWKQENQFSGSFITTVETDGRESGWVTLNVVRALRSLME